MNIQPLFDAPDSTLRQPIHVLLLGVGDIARDDKGVHLSIRLLAQFSRVVRIWVSSNIMHDRIIFHADKLHATRFLVRVDPVFVGISYDIGGTSESFLLSVS